LLVLASSSPRRRDLLASMGISFNIVKPDIDESLRPGEPLLDYVRRLSREKASRVIQNLPDEVTVLAADTVVILAADTMGIDPAGELLGKPATAAEARAMLLKLRGRTHQVYTALTLVASWARAARFQTTLTRTDVTMRDYTEEEIAAYIASGDPFDKAGGYAIQHEGFHPVARIDGSYSNVVGLPVETLEQMLTGMGIALLR
jgi:septum formation protein